MLRRTIALIVLLAVVAAGVNDTWRYVTTQQRLRATTYELARWAGDNAGTLSRDAAANKLVSMANQEGVTVYQYGQTDEGIQIWTESAVTDTIIVGTVRSLIAGVPISQAFRAPFTIRDYREAGVQ